MNQLLIPLLIPVLILLLIQLLIHRATRKLRAARRKLFRLPPQASRLSQICYTTSASLSEPKVEFYLILPPRASRRLAPTTTFNEGPRDHGTTGNQIRGLDSDACLKEI